MIPKKKPTENQEQFAKRDFTLTGAQQHGLTKATKQFPMSVCLSMTLGIPGHPWAFGGCEGKASEKQRAIRETRLRPHWCSAARLDEGHQAIPSVCADQNGGSPIALVPKGRTVVAKFSKRRAALSEAALSENTVKMQEALNIIPSAT